MIREGKVTTRTAMSQSEMDAEAAAADNEATATPESTPADAAVNIDPAAEATPEPVSAPESIPTPAPTEETPASQPSELDVLKQEMAAKQAKIDELTKRMRDDAGRYGGELSELRRMIAEMKEMRAATPTAPSTPAEPEPLADYDENVREGVKKIAKAETKAVMEELAKTKAEIAAAREEAVKANFDRYIDRVVTAVPSAKDLNEDPAFNAWLDSTKAGTGRRTLREELNECNAERDHDTAIAILRRYESEHPKAAAKPVETPRGPVKPSKEAQVAVPNAAGDTAQKKTAGPSRARMTLLEGKINNNTATKAEGEEYDRLVDAETRGELT